MPQASGPLHVDNDGAANGVAANDDAYPCHGCSPQRSVLLWHGDAGWLSVWREGIPLNLARRCCCAATAKRTDEPDKSQTPGNGYDGDLVAPMIRDVGLALAMGDTVVDVMAAQMGKAGSNQNGG